MYLDKTQIAIRERTFLETLDLALRVVREYALPLLGLLLLTAVPMAALNYFLLLGVAEPIVEFFNLPTPYYFFAMYLVVWQMPLVTAPMTLFLGQVLFTQQPEPGKIAREFFRSLPQLLWYQVVLRAAVIPLVFTWCAPYAGWPYLSEVILLERTPYRRRRGSSTITTWQRSQSLHSGLWGDAFARWLAAVSIGGLLLVSLGGSLYIVTRMFVRAAPVEGISHHGLVVFHAALWLVVGFFAVVRFLGYVDLRIRREGWEVELLMRAEALRLTRELP